MFERLTEKSIGTFGYDLKDHKHEVGEFGNYDTFFDYSMAVKQLGKYEDSCLSSEQVQEFTNAKTEGRLVVLPCKVGDTVYEPRRGRGIISEYEITEIIINRYGVSFFRWNLKEGIYSHLTGFPVECLGKTVFLTREAAEKALKKRGDTP
jgi:hypothetical protein